MFVKLLIIDDSSLIRTSLRALLGTVKGIAMILEAATLAEAMETARQHVPTLVILDLALPDGQGANIIQPLKQLIPAPFVAILTLLEEPAYRECCLKLGADWFFDKATGIDDLLEVVRRHAAMGPSIQPNRGIPNA